MLRNQKSKEYQKADKMLPYALYEYTQNDYMLYMNIKIHYMEIIIP